MENEAGNEGGSYEDGDPLRRRCSSRCIISCFCKMEGGGRGGAVNGGTGGVIG